MRAHPLWRHSRRFTRNGSNSRCRRCKEWNDVGINRRQRRRKLLRHHGGLARKGRNQRVRWRWHHCIKSLHFFCFKEASFFNKISSNSDHAITMTKSSINSIVMITIYCEHVCSTTKKPLVVVWFFFWWISSFIHNNDVIFVILFPNYF